jgi:hypothetical protein
MTVAEMLGKCSAQELTDWAAFEHIDGPLGAVRGDIQAGIVAATIANVNRGKSSRHFKPADFMPQWDRPGARTPEAMRSLMIALTRQLGGTVRGDHAG